MTKAEKITLKLSDLKIKYEQSLDHVLKKVTQKEKFYPGIIQNKKSPDDALPLKLEN